MMTFIKGPIYFVTGGSRKSWRSSRTGLCRRFRPHLPHHTLGVSTRRRSRRFLICLQGHTPIGSFLRLLRCYQARHPGTGSRSTPLPSVSTRQLVQRGPLAACSACSMRSCKRVRRSRTAIRIQIRKVRRRHCLNGDWADAPSANHPIRINRANTLHGNAEEHKIWPMNPILR